MTAFYLCTAVPKLRLKPGKLLQSTDTAYVTCTSLGALLWPSTDPYVAAAALLAQNQHRGWGANDEELQSTMLSGVIQSLAAGGGGGDSWAAGPVLVGGTSALTVVSGAPVSGAVFDLSSANGQIVLPPGGASPQTVTVGFVGTEAGFQGQWSVPAGDAANIQALGYAGLQTSVLAGQAGAASTFTWVPAANGGLGLWLKS